MFLDECKSLITQSFHTDWLKKFDFSNPLTLVNTQFHFANYLKDFVTEFFRKLNFSLLSGEYITNPEYIRQIDNIDEIIQQIPDTVEAVNKLELRDKYSNEILNSIINPIRLSLIQLKKFVKQISRNLSQQDDLYVLFDLLSYKGIDDDIAENNIFNIDINLLFKIFFINVQVAIADHTIALNKNLLRELLLFRKELEDSKIEEELYYLILKDKCDYLIKKIGVRFNEDKLRYLYAFDFEDKVLSVAEISIIYFSDFDKVTTAHYEENFISRQALNKQISSIEKKIRKSEELTFLDYHTIIRHYKDDFGNLEQVKNLIEEFEKVYMQHVRLANNDFDVRAYQTVYNYMLNNQLSLLLNQSDSYEDILNLMDKIGQIQNETKVKNFFPFLRFSIFLKNILEKEYLKETLSKERIHSYTIKLEQTLRKAFENFDWCKERHFLAYQAPFEESIIDFQSNETSIKLFLASSFVLPINYEKVVKELQELEREKNKYKTLFDVTVNISKQKKELEEMKTRIEHTDRRQIEILSIFAAIVLFVSANIQVFTKVNSASDALHFMFIFSYCLGSFVILIWLVTRTYSIRISKIHWFFIIAYLFITYLAIGSFLRWFPFNLFS